MTLSFWGLGYGYDRYGNLNTIAVTKCSAPTLSLSIDPTTNKITNGGFSYDLNGNLAADGFATFTWNAEGRMASTAGVSYTYDGDGKRTKKSNGKLYWYGINGQVLAESDLSGNITSEFIYFGSTRIARRDVASGNIYYFLADRLGSAHVVTNSTGGIVEESDYYPFGQERVITDSLDNNYKYTGHERDSESGLDHTLYRQHSSALGRWLSADPVRGDPIDPQSWNRYRYGGDNPCNMWDPDGGQEGYVDEETGEEVGFWFWLRTVLSRARGPLDSDEETVEDAIYYSLRDDCWRNQDRFGAERFAEIGVNIQEALQQREEFHRLALEAAGTPPGSESDVSAYAEAQFASWLWDKLENNGDWDFKSLPDAPSDAEAFGNFHFGAITQALGIPHYVAQNLAGYYQNRTRPDLSQGLLGIAPPYGDQKVDAYWIREGYNTGAAVDADACTWSP